MKWYLMLRQFYCYPLSCVLNLAGIEFISLKDQIITTIHQDAFAEFQTFMRMKSYINW